ncbi:MAG: Hsp20/alpha crystallin family protein [Thermoplasmatota archaeon]
MSQDPFDDLHKRLSDLWKAVQGSEAVAPDIDLEVFDDVGSFVITAEMREARREDIRVDVSASRVVIQAPRNRMPFMALERRPLAEPYRKSINLPAEVCPEDAQAHFNNGILEVVLPKRIRTTGGLRHASAG